MSSIQQARPACGLDLTKENENLAAFVAELCSICGSSRPFDCNACSSGGPCACKGKVIDVLTKMLNYLIEHFTLEETLFDPHLPPVLAESHRASHAEITRHLGEAIRLCWNTTACTAHDQELNALLQKHLKDHDTVLSEALQRRQSNIPAACLVHDPD